MNKNLQSKLAAKAKVVQSIQEKHPKMSAFELGKRAYYAIKGYYGKTINPFKNLTIWHREFRAGFKLQREGDKP